MVLLGLARAVVALVPFRIWRQYLGWAQSTAQAADPAAVHRLAAHVARAAQRLPFDVKCLPQAMALSWQMRRRKIAHTIVFAARPAGLRAGDHALHAWVERESKVILGELPGPWMEIYRHPAASNMLKVS